MTAPPERLLFSHAPAHSVYTVTFSPDGTLLAYGGGFWYGQGYVVCLDSETGRVRASLDFQQQTVSGLCFDASGLYLGASTWAESQRHAPAYVLKVADGTLALQQELQASRDWLEGGGDATPTGIFFWEGRAVVRHLHEDSARTFHGFEPSQGLVLRAAHPELTSSQFALLPGALLTAKVHRVVGKSGAELVLVTPRGRTTTLYPLPYPLRYSALTCDVARSTVLAGLSDGHLALYRVHPGPESPSLEALELWRGHEAAVTAACQLADGRHHATADDRGVVRVWEEQREVCSFSVPTLSIRSLAAHPTRPWLAVGGKFPGDGFHPGRVSVYDVLL